MSRDERSITRVAHVITGLGVGGAETMLARLIPALDRSIASSVICLSPGGPLADRIRANGVDVETLGLRSGPQAFLGLPALVRALKRLKPNLVHTWLYHADLLGGLAGRYCGIPVLWGLHNSTLDPAGIGRSTAQVVRLLAALSRVVPTRIVSCSEVGRRVHVAGGYDGGRMLVIPNGFDTSHFQPNPEFRSEARKLWGFSENEIAVGLVARFNVLKDHETFLRAAGMSVKREPRLRFVLYGDNVCADNTTLTDWARAAGVHEFCLFLGREPAMERRLPGLDLLVSSSTSEAFPLVLGEAMACGVPCVTTDAGDSAVIVGDPARVVPCRAPAALADAIVRAVHLDSVRREADVIAGVARVRTEFALHHIAERFRDLYLELASR